MRPHKRDGRRKEELFVCGNTCYFSRLCWLLLWHPRALLNAMLARRVELRHYSSSTSHKAPIVNVIALHGKSAFVTVDAAGIAQYHRYLNDSVDRDFPFTIRPDRSTGRLLVPSASAVAAVAGAALGPGTTLGEWLHCSVGEIGWHC